jgi:hypothetical protein
MTRGKNWAVLAFGVAGLAALWHVAAAFEVRPLPTADEARPAAPAVVRASAFVVEDADGVERGRLALDGDEMVLEAFGDGEEPNFQVRFLLDEHAPRLTVSSPPSGSIAILAVGELGGQPWFGLRKSKEDMDPSVFIGLQSMGPMIGLNDEGGPRITLSSFLRNPQLCLYGDEGRIFWHTPGVPGWDEKHGAALEEAKRKATEAAVEEVRKAVATEHKERAELIESQRH